MSPVYIHNKTKAPNAHGPVFSGKPRARKLACGFLTRWASAGASAPSGAQIDIQGVSVPHHQITAAKSVTLLQSKNIEYNWNIIHKEIICLKNARINFSHSKWARFHWVSINIVYILIFGWEGTDENILTNARVKTSMIWNNAFAQ